MNSDSFCDSHIRFHGPVEHRTVRVSTQTHAGGELRDTASLSDDAGATVNDVNAELEGNVPELIRRKRRWVIAVRNLGIDDNL